MPRPVRHALVAVLLLLLPTLCAAAYDPARLSGLYVAGEVRKAYEYAAEHRDEMEGDPAFDFYYGVSAIDSGEVSEGVFALERVLLIEPQNYLARLELARGYFILEEFDRSRQEFETVLAVDPPEPVKKKIDRFLRSIELQEGRYRTRVTGFLQGGIGWDSNVPAGPADDNIFFPNLGLFGRLDELAVETDDYFGELRGRLDVTVPMTRSWAFNTSLDSRLRGYQELSVFDNLDTTLQAGFNAFAGRDRYGINLLYQNYRLDDRDFRTLTGLNLDWRRVFRGGSNAIAYLQGAKLQYPDQEIRDSTLWTAGGGYTHAFRGRIAPLLFGTAYLGTEIADEDSDTAKAIAERDLYGLNLGAQFNASSQLAVVLRILYQQSDYGAEDILFGETREDQFLRGGLEVNWLLTRHWRLSFYATHSRNDSNIELNTYERTQAGTNVRYLFR